MVDADGILKVSAKEQLSGIEAAIDVKPSYGLTDEEVERMLVESFEHAEDDLAARNLRIERVEASGSCRRPRRRWPRTPPARARGRDRDPGGDGRARAGAAGTDHLAIRAGIEPRSRVQAVRRSGG